MDSMPLEAKLELLMSLAGDDREANPALERILPPRLRHANEVGALRPLNFRTVSAGEQVTLHYGTTPQDYTGSIEITF